MKPLSLIWRKRFFRLCLRWEIIEDSKQELNKFGLSWYKMRNNLDTLERPDTKKFFSQSPESAGPYLKEHFDKWDAEAVAAGQPSARF